MSESDNIVMRISGIIQENGLAGDTGEKYAGWNNNEV
jgi:hypothetical protein